MPDETETVQRIVMGSELDQLAKRVQRLEAAVNFLAGVVKAGFPAVWALCEKTMTTPEDG